MNGPQGYLKSEFVPNANQPIGIEKKCTQKGRLKTINKYYIDNEEHKKCSVCKKILPALNFPWKSKENGSHMARCLDCQHKYNKEIYYPKNKERIIKAAIKYHKSHRDKARMSVIKNTQKNIKINTESLKNILIPKDLLKCLICGFNESLIPLEGHHLDGSQKKYKEDTLSRWLRKSHKTFLNKTSNVYWILLCKNCHARLHTNEIMLPQNTKSLNIYFNKGEQYE